MSKEIKIKNLNLKLKKAVTAEAAAVNMTEDVQNIFNFEIVKTFAQCLIIDLRLLFLLCVCMSLLDIAADWLVGKYDN